MPLQQLNVRLPAELIAALRQESASTGRTLAAVVERRLSGLLATASAPAPELADQLATRLAAVEDRLAALEAQPQPPRPRIPVQRPLPAPPATAPVDPPPTGTAITTPELALLLGVKRGSFNERLRRAGGARIGLEMDGWRCAGQRTPETGGPPRWVWEQV